MMKRSCKEDSQDTDKCLMQETSLQHENLSFGNVEKDSGCEWFTPTYISSKGMTGSKSRKIKIEEGRTSANPHLPKVVLYRLYVVPMFFLF
jgi:hypothetical protein